MRRVSNFKKIVASALTVAMVATLPITANASGVYKESDTLLKNHMEYILDDGSVNSLNFLNNNPNGVMMPVIKDATDINNSLVALAYGNTYGPIVVAHGTLIDNDNTSTPVYAIGLKGTDMNDKENAIGIDTDIIVGLQNANNPYTKAVKNTILSAIPEGSNLMMFGHSLGGMVCQQVIADSEIKAKYNILYTVTSGSPLIGGDNREGVVTRLGDTSDPIPYLSVTGKFVSQIWGLNREDGHFTTGLWSIQEGWDAHCNSYNKDIWRVYDVTGKKGGHAKLLVNPNTVRVARAPKIN